MSPDTLHFTANEAMNGNVFGFQLNTFGLARTDRKVIANIEEWAIVWNARSLITVTSLRGQSDA